LILTAKFHSLYVKEIGNFGKVGVGTFGNSESGFGVGNLGKLESDSGVGVG